MKKLLTLLLTLLLVPAALAEDSGVRSLTTANGLTLTFYTEPYRNYGGDTAELLLQGFYLDERWEDAYALSLLLADAGDSEALIRLAGHHLSGLGAAQDDAAALALLTRALEAGNPYVRFDLALVHLNGWGVPADRETAVALLTELSADDSAWPLNSRASACLQALSSHDPLPSVLTTRPMPWLYAPNADDAMCLGYFWKRGEGGVVDHHEAARWFEKALSLSDADVAAQWSHAALAEYYRDGVLGVYDIEKALHHASFLTDYHSFAGDMYRYGVTAADGTVILTPDMATAISYYEQGAGFDVACMEFLADAYWSGEHVARDEARAIDLYMDGLQSGSRYCALKVEALYSQGLIRTPEQLQSLAWAIANGADSAAPVSFVEGLAQDLLLGRTAEDGSMLIEPGQYKPAWWLLSTLTRWGIATSSSACINEWTGWFYMGNAPEVQKADHAKAFTYYKVAARQGSGSAWQQLGLMYQEGLGVAADEVQARACFERAIELGCEPAQQHLDALNAQ